MSSPTEQISQLEAAIHAQEALRPTLGDAAVNAIIAAARAQLDVLRSQSVETLHGEVGPLQDTGSLLARLMPQELAAKMRATGHIEGERRQVTVLFGDLSGFTALGEQFDPEFIHVLQSELLPELAGAVYQFEGYVDNFIGDAIMAIFGAPIAHEDDPERALLTALEMRSRVEALSRRWQGRLGQPLALHIGVNSGTVVTGQIEAEVRFSYAVTGDTVNTASRLQSAAQPGQILVGLSTYRLTQGAFNFIALDPITVKGKRAPLPVFELQRTKLLPSKTRGVKELGEAFVGRERELAQLRDVLAELEAGRGRIVSINGEAGIGKSRLLAEWRREAGESVHWLEGRAFAHTTSLAYGVFLDLMRRYARIKDDDSEAEARARLDEAIAHQFPDNIEARALVAHLLALRLTPVEATVLADLPGEVLRRRLFALIAEFLDRLARERPTIVVAEDIHWADYTSLELIESLLPLARRAPLALVGVRRLEPDERPSKLRVLVESQYADLFTDIALAPLSETTSLNMVEQLLSTSALPESLRALILTKAEGNPFFVEEVMRSLIERGALKRSDGGGWKTTSLIESISVPDTVQGVLMARLDALPEKTKWVLQQASVIGRVFSDRVLRQLAETDVDEHLKRLEREDLIRSRTRLPEVEYLFKHALTQEVAYQSLLAPRRKELHRKVGAVMEVSFAERLTEFQSIIGEHFLRGEDWERASDYLCRAGEVAGRLYAHTEARAHYAHALEAMAHLPDNDANRRRRVDTLINQGAVAYGAEDPGEYLARLADAEALLKTLQGADGMSIADQRRLARLHFWMGRTHYYRREPLEAIAFYMQVMQEARELGDEDLLAIPYSVLGQVMGMQGHFGSALPLLTQAAALLQKTAAQFGEWVLAAGWRSSILAHLGQYIEGKSEGEHICQRVTEMNYPTGIAESHSFLGFICLVGGELQRAVEEARAFIDMSEQLHDNINVYVGYGLLATAESRLGEHERARLSMMKSIEVGQSIGGRLFFDARFAAVNAEIAFNSGRVNEAATLAEQAAAFAQSDGDVFAEGHAHRIWGQALARLTPQCWDEAEAHFSNSLRLLESGEAKLEAARTQVAWGIACRERGNDTAAREHIEQAAAQFEASGLTEELERTRRLIL